MPLGVVDEILAERILGLQVVRDLRPGGERLGHVDPVPGAVQGERGAAHHHDVMEPQGPQVVSGHLAPHRQGAGPVQHRPREPLHRRLHRLQRRGVAVQRELCAAGEHEEGDLQALEELCCAQELTLELRTKGIGQGKDEPVVLIVHDVGHLRVDAVIVRVDHGVPGREQLVRRGPVDEVSAVRAQQVLVQGVEGVHDVERGLAEPHQVPSGHGVAISGIGRLPAAAGPDVRSPSEGTARERDAGRIRTAHVGHPRGDRGPPAGPLSSPAGRPSTHRPPMVTLRRPSS